MLQLVLQTIMDTTWLHHKLSLPPSHTGTTQLGAMPPADVLEKLGLQVRTPDGTTAQESLPTNNPSVDHSTEGWRVPRKAHQGTYPRRQPKP